MTKYRPVVLCVLDGWGHRVEAAYNAIAQAKTPVWDELIATCPHSLLDASGLSVGLPQGQMGNSEVGHMTIGAGRVILQDLPRIDLAITTGKLASNPVLMDLISQLKQSGGTCHLYGLLSPGGVHSHESHLFALAEAVAAAGVPVKFHAFLDGRDTPPQSGVQSVEAFLKRFAGNPCVQLATLSGRFYAMDRDKRWERVQAAYDALVMANAPRIADPVAFLQEQYAKNIGDEFVSPVVMTGYEGMQDGDGLLCGNFRADRVRQLLNAFLMPDFKGFARARRVAFAGAVGLSAYEEALTPLCPALFPSADVVDHLGACVAAAGLRQLRLAETEKYAHVTFFLNGGHEAPEEGEDRILVPSPKVATYDLQPEMSAAIVTDHLVEAVRGEQYELIVVNYANTDMVGHSGDLAASIVAVETIDTCLGRIQQAVLEVGGILLITADHGNVEQVYDVETQTAHTAHTLNPVPFVVVGGARMTVTDGGLQDVAPTVLSLLDLPQPLVMTGQCLISERLDAQNTARTS